MKVLLDDNDGLTTIGNLKYSVEENIWVAEINWVSLQLTESLSAACYSGSTEITKAVTEYRQMPK